MNNNPIYCAIDTSDIKQAIALIEKIRPFIGGLKLGLEFYTHCGIEGINKIKGLGLPMFIDLKLFDIPNTTKSALQGILASKPELTTLHISGGSEMLRGCVDIRNSSKSETKLIGVTVLTSFDENGIKEVGLNSSLSDQVIKLARLAVESKLDGIVCSPHEIKLIKSEIKDNLKLIVPGIRSNENNSNDQKRIMSAKEAIDAGADILIIGRPITKAIDPAKAAKKILQSLK
ncbi:orotidine-5'-phosphate decarboxylase [Pelagibacteraceae bacterium]|nr:orotidine-5'-phosphate decarboxylase [Pelagibacteraceae bacterium]